MHMFRGEWFQQRIHWPKSGGRREPGSDLEVSLVQAVRFSWFACISGGNLESGDLEEQDFYLEASLAQAVKFCLNSGQAVCTKLDAIVECIQNML